MYTIRPTPTLSIWLSLSEKHFWAINPFTPSAHHWQGNPHIFFVCFVYYKTFSEILLIFSTSILCTFSDINGCSELSNYPFSHAASGGLFLPWWLTEHCITIRALKRAPNSNVNINTQEFNYSYGQTACTFTNTWYRIVISSRAALCRSTRCATEKFLWKKKFAALIPLSLYY